jgi:DNA polymerase IIIc chi subunit
MQIFFMTASNNLSKLSIIGKICQKHFLLRESIQIQVQDEYSAKFIDDLIWKNPIVSFLPHNITNIESNEKIIITTTPRNLNQASILINLTSKASTIVGEFALIYELLDKTNQEKHHLSLEKIKTYEKMTANLTYIENLL